ncbi:protein of unknown function UPF0052 [Dethiosulfovibrio peptidovorans DSM 11002]|uniref:Putative gluconeogenesis factor n=1 Tax=Dethiosulfovibrio peptidovorans DSM 11002 TaxID=469381 RepID=D2Z3B6_9BACT|nr:protein of unknown function UPF0052 [Dethiosulfovibrio peptidovorans DSM 11002]
MRHLWPFLWGLSVGVIAGALFKRRRTGFRSSPPTKDSGVSFRLSSGPYVVAVGGGTGLSAFLMGLKGFTKNITAVVTVTDEGGSSGRITRDWGVLPPGDIRNCIVALSENDDVLRSFMDFRFDKGDLAGHSLGNLMLLASAEMTGDFKLAVERINQLLAIRGRVLPVSTENIVLRGKTSGGKQIKGELEISNFGTDLDEIWLEPSDAKPIKEVIAAVDTADLIVLGPGSLFTSVIPNLLIRNFRERIKKGLAPTVYVANIMTQPRETEGMSVTGHLNWIEKVLGKLPDYVIVNDQEVPRGLLERYKAEGAEPLYLNDDEEVELYEKGCKVLRGSFLRLDQVKGEPVIRHDGGRLSEAIFSLIQKKDGGTF